MKKLDVNNLNKRFQHKNATTQSHNDSINLISTVNREKLINYYHRDFSIFGYKETNFY